LRPASRPDYIGLVKRGPRFFYHRLWLEGRRAVYKVSALLAGRWRTILRVVMKRIVGSSDEPLFRGFHQDLCYEVYLGNRGALLKVWRRDRLLQAIRLSAGPR